MSRTDAQTSAPTVSSPTPVDPVAAWPFQKVLDQAACFDEAGYREFVVTGINVGKYGIDLDEGENIYSLLDRLCTQFPALRIRLSSIEPTEVNDQLLNLVVNHNNFMPHLHIPLQSGDDNVLRRMYRQYTTTAFQEAVQAVHTAIPHAAIGCDILGGFPGETDSEAENTYQFIHDLPITYLHVFPYSKRQGTLAASFRNQISGPVKNKRVKRLRELDEQLRNKFHKQQLGTDCQVLVERRHKKSGLLQGFSENYIPLLFSGPTHLIHRWYLSALLNLIKANQSAGLLKRCLRKTRLTSKVPPVQKGRRNR